MNVRNQKGAVAALVAVMLVLIMVCVALVVDLGHIHNVKALMQRAVDAGALAGAIQLPDEDLAKDAAVAATNQNMASSTEGDLKIAVENVEVGHWDIEALGSEAAVRFVADDTPLNAVLVTATKEVDHVFFFFLPSTTVTTDAIAVRESNRPSLPVAFVSCIPTNPEDRVLAPGLQVCDVAYYKFKADTDDTAAWTSLTFSPLSKPNLEKFLTPEGSALFNEVIWGGDPASKSGSDGLENTPVEQPDEYGDNFVDLPTASGSGYTISDADSCDGQNINPFPTVNIQCGLGTDFDPSASQTDPLQYGTPSNNSLPRWYYPQFRDVALMNGLFDTAVVTELGQNYLIDLWQASTIADVTARNTAFDAVVTNHIANLSTDAENRLADKNDPIPAVLRDGRFARFILASQSGGGISLQYKKVAEIMRNIDGGEVMRYAGYPQVVVNNGEIPGLLRDGLLPLITDDDGDFITQLNFPFDTPLPNDARAFGETVLLTVPIVYAGTCENWKGLSTGANHALYFIGTANFLMTRAWHTSKKCFDAPDAIAVQVDVTNLPPPSSVYSGPASACNDADDFVPALAADDKFTCIEDNEPAAFEGLLRPPGGLDEEGAIAKIYLVE